jgi:DNA end-binding protein Ku
LARIAEEKEMGSHPYWSGRLRMSLVQFGIQLYPAVSPQVSIAFHEIDRETGERIHHLNVIGQNRPVDNTDIVKGYEYKKGKYLTVDPEEIAKLRIESKNVIEIKRFVELSELHHSLFERPYFVVPQPKEPVDAFSVVRRAMQDTGKAAIGEIAFGGREHLIAIAVPDDPSERGLMAYTLRYGEELRKSADYFSRIPRTEIDKKQLAMAAELIRSYSGPLKLDDFKDDYLAALRKLLEAKQKNRPLPLEEDKPGRAKVIDLMDALRQSVDKTKRPIVSPKRAGRGVEKGLTLVKSSKRKRRAA